MTEAQTYALLFLTLGIAALFLMFVARKVRLDQDRKDRPAKDAREFLAAEARRVK